MFVLRRLAAILICFAVTAIAGDVCASIVVPKVVLELSWEESQNKLPEDIPFQESIEAYVAKVFDCCYSHMNPEK